MDYKDRNSRGFFVMWEMDYGMQNIDFEKFSLSPEFVILTKFYHTDKFFVILPYLLSY